jgi:hypothetical protein
VSARLPVCLRRASSRCPRAIIESQGQSRSITVLLQPADIRNASNGNANYVTTSRVASAARGTDRVASANHRPAAGYSRDRQLGRAPAAGPARRLRMSSARLCPHDRLGKWPMSPARADDRRYRIRRW